MSLSLTNTNNVGQSRPLEAVRVLVVDDHPLVRHGLVALIGSEPGFDVCAQADCEDSALQAIRESRPDLAVIGLSNRKSSTLELVRRVHMVAPEVRVLVSSPHEDTLYAERALKAGAMAYVSRSETVEHTLDALHRVRSGKIYLSDTLSERLLDRVVAGKNDAQDSTFELLSRRELQVFELIGEGVPTGQIAEQLNLSVKTIETHQAHIKKKLGLGSAHELNQRAIRWIMEQEV